MGEALNPEQDFDHNCVGYPTGQQVPDEWKQDEFLFDTTKSGMRNTGHDKGVLLDAEGHERLTPDDKRAVIEFLKTL